MVLDAAGWSSQSRTRVRTAQDAPKKHGNHGAVALCSQRGRVKRGEQCLALFRCQPVTEADAETPNALDRPNTASD
jgi:hypothetical protein